MIRKLFSLVDIVVPSEDEVRRLMGRDFNDMELAAHLLCTKYGARNACVKAGRDGCIVYEKEKDRTTRVGICKVDVKDPTGAGDSFCGGFTVGLRETGSYVEAARYQQFERDPAVIAAVCIRFPAVCDGRAALRTLQRKQ